MFTSYNKRGRSLSTTDVYRLGEDDKENLSRDSSSLTRLTRNKQIRRPTTKPPPVPPQRSDSFGASSKETTTLTRVRSYLSDDIRKKFESTARTVEQRSPSSSNFVKKLVATLERRQKDNDKIPDNCIFRDVSFRNSNRRERAASVVSPRFVFQSRRNHAATLSPPPSPIIDFSSARISQLEEVHEVENEDEFDDFDSDSSNPDDYFSDMWPARPLQDKLPVIMAYPSNPINPTSSNSGNSRKPNGRRSLIKNMFSSFANWKIGGKGLPKGSRDYYAARESLGEEMRAFRRDTMPRLMEHAAHNSRLTTPEISAERPRRDTQDFAKLIPRPANAQIQQQPSPQSVATIHPIYKASSHQVYSTVEPPSPPVQPRQSSTMTTTTAISPDEQLLLRPSRMRELQKRLSQEIDSLATVQLRSSVQYDVPRSNRPVAVVREYPHYENVSPASQDKRLSCSLFTTF